MNLRQMMPSPIEMHPEFQESDSKRLGADDMPWLRYFRTLEKILELSAVLGRVPAFLTAMKFTSRLRRRSGD